VPQVRDDFSKPVADALAKRAAFICSNPSCRALTIAPSEADDGKFLYIGVAAHIRAAAEGGPRYDRQMAQDERKSASNGVFLCNNCATMIDKNQGLDFPVGTLREWKEGHEGWVRANLNKRQPDQHQAAIFNVTSIGQSGGITAGIVNVGPQPRRLDEGLKTQLAQLLPNKTREVKIQAILGDSEAIVFATQIKNYLNSRRVQSGRDQPVGFWRSGSTAKLRSCDADDYDWRKAVSGIS
jgi:hypothetical protein